MKKIYTFLIIVIAIVSCSKDDGFDLPIVHTGEVTGITSEGADFSAKITNMGKYGIIEYGFVWDYKSKPTIEKSEKYIIQGAPSAGVYSHSVSTTLNEGIEYYVRSFVRTTQSITYGEEVSFMSLGSKAPEITGFLPREGNLNDTLTITGHNFSYIRENNHVMIGPFPAVVIKTSQDTIMAIVPDQLNTIAATVKVSILGNEAVSTGRFDLIPPVINDFSPKTGTFGDQISIFGDKFLKNPASLHVYFGDFIANIVSIHNEIIVVTVPDGLIARNSNIKVVMNNLTAISAENYRLSSLVLSDFSPKVVLTGNTITLTGNNFSPIATNNKVKIGGLQATVTSSSLNELHVTVPFQNSGNYTSRNVTINVQVAGEEDSYNGTLLINDKWFRLKNSPISVNDPNYAWGYVFANCFVSGGKAYIGLNGKGEFWEYDIQNDHWKRLADFPGVVRWHGTGFVLDNKIYFGTGVHYFQYFKDWWEYDISNNSWQQKNDFPSGERMGAAAFTISDVGYIGTGRDDGNHSSGFNDFWKYNPLNDTWNYVTKYAFDDYVGTWLAVAVSQLSDVYIGAGNVPFSGEYSSWMYKYNPASNHWTKIANYPFAGSNNYAMGFTLNNKVYISTSFTNDFYYYNESSNNWTKLQTDILTDYKLGIAFSANGKAYVGLGTDNAMWEYDPSR